LPRQPQARSALTALGPPCETTADVVRTVPWHSRSHPVAPHMLPSLANRLLIGVAGVTWLLSHRFGSSRPVAPKQTSALWLRDLRRAVVRLCRSVAGVWAALCRCEQLQKTLPTCDYRHILASSAERSSGAAGRAQRPDRQPGLEGRCHPEPK
jgi:hypothetical protein